MKPIFNRIKLQKPGRNVFDLSHERKLSLRMGKLYPVFMQETVPGDKFRINTEIFLRMAPLVSPVMHRVNVYVHFFFVPYRLLWDDWEKFITGGVDGLQLPVMPYINIKAGDEGSMEPGGLVDHFGIPTWLNGTIILDQNGVNINALPFRAYHKVYNEYYRDQTLNTEHVTLKTSGEVVTTERSAIFDMHNRCWEKDYFTSALPDAQRGGAVILPSDIDYLNPARVTDSLGQPVVSGETLQTGSSGALVSTPSSPGPLSLENIDNLGITVNDLRRSVRLQEWLERNMRAGSRYVEQIFAHFGVRSSDARLQRPEFLGGSKQPVVLSEVLSTYSVAGNDPPVGTMAGHGVSVGAHSMVNKYFEEHGLIMGIMSVLPRTAYQQGLPKFFSKFDKFDFYFPEFANIGEQIVYNREIYFDPSSGLPHDNEGEFGYQSRYAEYKFTNSTVHGDFRTNLNFWHMGRIFSDLPVLNGNFVTADPTERVFAVNEENYDKMYCQMYHEVKAIRPMPVFGTPSI